MKKRKKNQLFDSFIELFEPKKRVKIFPKKSLFPKPIKKRKR